MTNTFQFNHAPVWLQSTKALRSIHGRKVNVQQAELVPNAKVFELAVSSHPDFPAMVTICAADPIRPRSIYAEDYRLPLPLDVINDLLAKSISRRVSSSPSAS